jgi:spore germination cell wall hydrolase CwlJ-like protein
MPELIFQQLNDEQLMAVNGWAEARGEPLLGEDAVMWTVKNRMLHPGWWGHDYKSVILCPEQYSWLLPGNPRTEDREEHEACIQFAEKVQAGMSDPDVAKFLSIAKGVIDGAIPDPTGGATNYFAASMHPWPNWAPKMHFIMQIGGHRFYKP